ncbi:beta-ketoacyl-[acyl-carrier-protein] synthase family protein [Dokdonella sp. MW10]|uniref:beta-ketoacyl-[acyl-carrier-protein] synthase family protein n=1 Tax=Dokdonella sp. MW10 TaxID=2992926 RepID=UPI003F7CFD97
MPDPIDPIAVTAYTATSALGRGRDAHLAALRERRSGLRANDFTAAALPCAIGRVDGVEDAALPDALATHECRNNRLAWLALQADGFLDAARAAIARHGASRVALLLGTSTASIGESEASYRDLEDGRMPAWAQRPEVHNPHSLGLFLRNLLGVRGPCLTTATACSSSAKIFAKAERMIRLGLVDAAILAGVDTLCDSVLYGFNSLELVSPDPCRPFDVARRGISIGEAAGFALLERDGDATRPHLVGWGESSDAHHMSTPHPEGLGARLAMTDALARAGLTPADVGYINLHGTATPKNDEVEAGVVAALFPAHVRASSTKGWTGHTLGAAGILEAVVSLLVLEHGVVPGLLGTTELDPVCGPQIAIDNANAEVCVALSNSFGFGGSNSTLAFARGRRAA